MVGYQPCPQMLHKGGSDWHWQTLYLITIRQELLQTKAQYNNTQCKSPWYNNIYNNNTQYDITQYNKTNPLQHSV
jgi:hypothetical protein